MKKILITVTILTFTASCSRDYTCVCDNQDKNINELINANSRDKAEKECEDKLQDSDWIECVLVGS